MANFSLLAKIGLDSKGFQKGLNSAKAGVGKFGKAVLNVSNRLAKMGLASAAAGFALLSRNAISLGSQLSDIAANTGFATKEFQVFRGALIDAGGTTTSMEKSIVTMQKAIVQGSEGLTTYTRAFERLGLNIDDIKAMKPEAQFMAIGKAIASASNQQEALTSAIEIFGQRNAGRLIEVFDRLNKDGYGKMAEDIKEAYGIMDAETQQALDKAADTIERFKNKATIFVGELIAGEADGAALKKLGFKILEVAANFGKGLFESIMDAVAIARNGFGAFADFFFAQMSSTIGLLGTLIKINFSKALNPMIEKLNKIPGVDIGVINTDKLMDDLDKDLKKGKKTFADFFMERQNSQEKFEMQYDPGKFWKEASEAEERKLQISRKLAAEKKQAAKESVEAILGAGGIDDDTGDDDNTVDSSSNTRGTSGEASSEDSLTGHNLRRAANLAGKGESESGGNIRFEKLGDGGFQKFIDGSKAEKLSQDELQKFVAGGSKEMPSDKNFKKNLQNDLSKDGDTKALLEKINTTLEGKFVSQ